MKKTYEAPALVTNGGAIETTTVSKNSALIDGVFRS